MKTLAMALIAFPALCFVFSAAMYICQKNAMALLPLFELVVYLGFIRVVFIRGRR